MTHTAESQPAGSWLIGRGAEKASCRVLKRFSRQPSPLRVSMGQTQAPISR